jgi:hypothetical protein
LIGFDEHLPLTQPELQCTVDHQNVNGHLAWNQHAM